MARVAKEQQTKVTTRKDAKYPGETLLEVSFGAGTQAYQGCLVSIYVDALGSPVIDIYRADEKIRVLVPSANFVLSNETK